MRVVTAAVLRNISGALLIVRRGPEESLSGYWEFPGGKVELDETEHGCLKRELKEELAIDVEVGQFIAENHYVYRQGEFLLLKSSRLWQGSL